MGAVADMLSNNFYIRTKTKISPRRITLLLISANHISPHLSSKPILPFPKGRNKLLCFVKDFSKSIKPMNISPHLASPEGEGLLLCFDIDWWMQVTIVNDKSPIIRLPWVIIKLPWVIIR